MTDLDAKAGVVDLKAAAVQAIEARIMSGQPFTYMHLCFMPAVRALIHDKGRTPDRIIQKWRRKGLIVFERRDRQTIWSLTDAGRAKAQGGAA